MLEFFQFFTPDSCSEASSEIGNHPLMKHIEIKKPKRSNKFLSLKFKIKGSVNSPAFALEYVSPKINNPPTHTGLTQHRRLLEKLRYDLPILGIKLTKNKIRLK